MNIENALKDRRYNVFLQRFYRYLQHHHDAQKRSISHLSLEVWISGQRVDPRMVRSRIAYAMDSVTTARRLQGSMENEEMCESREIIE